MELIDEKNSNLSDKFIVSNDSIDNDLDSYLSGNFKRGLGIGIEGFDEYFLLKENQLWASTGKKGGGKTTITQINYLMWTICHKMKCVVAYKENDDWHVKFNLLSMLLGVSRYEMEEMHKGNNPLLLKAKKWINKYYIFLNVKSIKEATDTVIELMNKGEKIHTLIIDPANSFLSGFSDTGNTVKDNLITATEVLDFTSRHCSVHVSQHPIVSKQREQGDVTSYDAENGVYLNKAHGTYCINRDKGTSENRIWIDNERTTHMGGGQTHPDDPIIMKWRPDGIDLLINGVEYLDVIQTLRKKHNPLDEIFADELPNFIEPKNQKIPNATLDDAFGDDDTPF